jgi:hypothetical protein
MVVTIKSGRFSTKKETLSPRYANDYRNGMRKGGAELKKGKYHTIIIFSSIHVVTSGRILVFLTAEYFIANQYHIS